MGLDSYVYRIKKPEAMESRVYSRDEIRQLGLSSFATEDTKDNPLAADLLAYTVKVRVNEAFLNMEKVRKDYHLSDAAHAYGWNGDGSIEIMDDAGGQYRTLKLTSQEIKDRYTLMQVVEYNVFYEETVAYWRKNYDVQSFFYDHIERLENTGYYRLDEELLREFNECSPDDDWGKLPVEAPTDESALFYWEWY